MASFRSFGCIIIFILSILRGNPANIIVYLRDRYNISHVKCYRRLEDTSKKLAKAELDLIIIS